MTIYNIRVKGPTACFTLPYGPERYSGLIPSHDGCVGLLKSVIGPWEMTWRVHELHLLAMPRRMTIMTNELKNFPGKNYQPIAIEAQRTQRRSTVLRGYDVLLKASIELTGRGTHAANLNKFNETFLRRMSKGQLYSVPYFGQREYGADSIELVQGELPKPVDHSEHFGPYYYGYDYQAGVPYFYPLIMKQGVVKYPSWKTVLSKGLRGVSVA